MKIEIENLSKSIRGVQILDHISLELHGGKIYGLSGKNGSGKTMLMRAACGLIKPTEGRVLVDGKELGKELSFPPSVGALIENPAFINKYSGYKNLKVLAEIQNKIGEAEIREILARVGLDPDDPKSYRKYSLGMKQRLGIACALMEKPDLILLDEPINALDENGVLLVKALLGEARRRGALILLSAHDKEELEFLSDEIFYLSEGKITAVRNIAKEEEG